MDGAVDVLWPEQSSGSHRQRMHLQPCCVLLGIGGKAGVAPGLVLNHDYLSQVIQPQFINNSFDPDTLQSANYVNSSAPQSS